MWEHLGDTAKIFLKGWLKEHSFPDSSGYRKKHME
jgi:hypothetical protein